MDRMCDRTFDVRGPVLREEFTRRALVKTMDGLGQFDPVDFAVPPSLEFRFQCGQLFPIGRACKRVSRARGAVGAALL